MEYTAPRMAGFKVKVTIVKCDMCGSVVEPGEINSITVIVNGVNTHTFRHEIHLCGECGSPILELATTRKQVLAIALGD